MLYPFEVQKIVKKNGAHINEDTFISLLLARQVSEKPLPLIYQIKIEHFVNDISLNETGHATPWDIIVSKQGGSYANAIMHAMISMEFQFPFVRYLINENAYREVEESQLHGLIEMLSDVLPMQLPLSFIYEDFMRRKLQLPSSECGNFYTPKGVVQCISALLNPRNGSLYDPCCGSGAMLLGASQNMLKNSDSTLCGQTQDVESYKICKMNLILNNLDVDLGEQPASSLTHDQHPKKSFDYIIANPPFNQSEWYEDYSICRDSRWRYGFPPRSNANFAWLQHVLSHLKKDGCAAVIMPNGTLTSRTFSESAIRQAILCDGRVEAIITFPAGLFYSTKVPFCVWLINGSDKKQNNILLIDAEKLHSKIKKTITSENIEHLNRLIDQYRKGGLHDRTELYAVVSLEEIAQKEYILSPNLYTAAEHLEPSAIRKNKPRLEACIHELQAILTDDDLLVYLTQWQQREMTSSWEKATLPELYHVFGGLSKKKEAFGQGYSLLDIKTIIRNSFLPDALDAYVQASEAEAIKYNIQYGDILLNRTSETIDELACCCVAEKDSDAIYASFVKRLRPKDKQTIYPLYAAGYFRSIVYRREIARVSTVFTTRANIDNTKLSKVSIYYPKLDMQRKIGDTLFAIFRYRQDNTDMKQRELLLEFERLFIEQYITYPILRLWETEDLDK